jgi:hypothetical protein
MSRTPVTETGGIVVGAGVGDGAGVGVGAGDGDGVGVGVGVGAGDGDGVGVGDVMLTAVVAWGAVGVGWTSPTLLVATL